MVFVNQGRYLPLYILRSGLCANRGRSEGNGPNVGATGTPGREINAVCDTGHGSVLWGLIRPQITFDVGH